MQNCNHSLSDFEKVVIEIAHIFNKIKPPCACHFSITQKRVTQLYKILYYRLK